MDYYNKYLKYKTKYLELKYYNQYGSGVVPCDKGYKNLLGTCWAVATQMIFSFGHVTSNQLNEKMELFNTGTSEERLTQRDAFIEKQINEVYKNLKLYDFLPEDIFHEPKRDHLKTMLTKFVDRYNSKVFDSHLTQKPMDISTLDENITNRDRCERVIGENYNKLFDYKLVKEELNSSILDLGSMTILDNYLFFNLLSIFFLDYKVSFTNYYNNFNTINFDRDNDLGMLIIIKGHVCCLYICDNKEQFYNDNLQKIVQYDWIRVLNSAPSAKNLYIGDESLYFINEEEIAQFQTDQKVIERVEFLTKISKYKDTDTDTQLDIDIKKALLFDNLDTIKDPDLCTIISKIYIDNRDYPTALTILNPALVDDYYPAITLRADMFKNGQGSSREYTQAIELYTKSIKLGDPRAYVKLGDMYKNGHGVSFNDSTALNLYTYGSFLGDKNAYVKLAEMYEDETGTNKNEKNTFHFYNLAMMSGNKSVYVKLGDMHYNGIGTEKNYDEAFKLYNLAADSKVTDTDTDEHSHIYTMLGIMYEKAQGTTKNLQKALDYFTKADNKKGIARIKNQTSDKLTDDR
jgi:TPR repeat protein